MDEKGDEKISVPQRPGHSHAFVSQPWSGTLLMACLLGVIQHHGKHKDKKSEPSAVYMISSDFSRTCGPSSQKSPLYASLFFTRSIANPLEFAPLRTTLDRSCLAGMVLSMSLQFL